MRVQCTLYIIYVCYIIYGAVNLNQMYTFAYCKKLYSCIILPFKIFILDSEGYISKKINCSEKNVYLTVYKYIE